MVYSDKAKEIVKNFWNYPEYPFVPKNLLEYYSNNYERLISNANTIINDNSVECAIFWSELIRSDFIVKFSNDIKSLFDHKKEIKDVNEAIKIIKNSFENSYYYFAFLTIADINSTKDLYEFWYRPYRAKESAKEAEANPWKIEKDIVSGKFWVINNCPLLKLATFDVKLLRKIRDYESHENLVIKEDSIYLLDGKNIIELKIQEVIEIASFLKGCIGLLFHFYSPLLMKERFWIFLSLYIVREKKYKEANIPFHILKKKKSNETKKSLNSLFSPLVGSIVEICISYSLYQLWIDLENESERVNVRLQKMNLKFNKEIVPELKAKAMCDFYNTIALFVYNTKRLSLGIKTEYKEVGIDEVKNLNFEQLIKNAKDTYLDVMRLKKYDENIWLLISLMLGAASIIILPIHRLIENFESLLIEK